MNIKIGSVVGFINPFFDYGIVIGIKKNIYTILVIYTLYNSNKNISYGISYLYSSDIDKVLIE